MIPTEGSVAGFEELAEALSLGEGFQFSVLLCPTREVADPMVDRLRAATGEGPLRLRPLLSRDPPTPEVLVEALLQPLLEPVPRPRVVVLDASGALDSPAWRIFFQRLNLVRNRVVQSLSSSLVLLLPSTLLPMFARHAPDLWSIRALVVEEPLPRPEYDPARPWFFVPFQPKGAGMVGRDAGLERVRGLLSEGRPTAIGHVAAFTGMGGIGKTQLAVEYCWSYREDYPGGVYWFTADQDVESQMIRLSDEARWARSDTEPALKLQMATHRLRSVQNALFVYDNVERALGPQELQPKPGPGCHILLTSRMDQPAFARVDLRLLDPAQSRVLLCLESGRSPSDPTEDAAVDRICAWLDGLPLALELAGAFLRRRPSRTFAEYGDLLERRGLTPTVAAEPWFATRSATRHEARLADTLRVSGALLLDQPDLERALDLLAWSAPASMGWPLLSELVRPPDPDRLRDGADLAQDLRIVRREDVQGDPSGPRFRMHRLVQEVRRQERPLGSLEGLGSVVERLTSWFQARRQDFADLPIFEAELDHLVAWTPAADVTGTPDARVRLRWLRAYPLWHRGQYLLSLEWIDQALALYAELGLSDPVLEAHLRSDRGVVLNLLGRSSDALSESQQAFTLRMGTLGEQHEDTARSLDNLGATLANLGRYKEALDYSQRALAIRRKVLGDRHLETAASYANVGGSLLGVGDTQSGLDHCARALSLRRDLLGDRHPDTAFSYLDLGHCYRLSGERDRALDLQRRGLEIATDTLGDDHPKLGRFHRFLAMTLLDFGEYPLALSHGHRAHEISVRSLGDHHPDTAESLTTLARILLRCGQHREALVSAGRALALRRGFSGPEHPATARTQVVKANAHYKLGEYLDARRDFERALPVLRSSLGWDHSETVSTAISLLVCRMKLSERAEAFALARDMVHRLPPTTPRYKELIHLYNRSRPAGHRALPPEGPCKKKRP